MEKERRAEATGDLYHKYIAQPSPPPPQDLGPHAWSQAIMWHLLVGSKIRGNKHFK